MIWKHALDLLILQSVDDECFVWVDQCYLCFFFLFLGFQQEL